MNALKIFKNSLKLHKSLIQFSNVTQYSTLKFAHDFELTDKSIKLSVSKVNDKNLSKEFPYIWLRDNCKCSKCFDSKVLEINYDFTYESLDIKPKEVTKIDGDSDKSFKIKWSDGHDSSYNLNDLINFAFENELKEKRKLKLWNSSIITSQNGLPTYNYAAFMNDETVLKKLLESLIEYGSVKINEIPKNIDDSIKALERISFLQRTLYGQSTMLKANENFGDSSYTNVSLKSHNDGTYWKNAPGLQCFQLISHDGTGGESSYVDGFYCANLLKKNHPNEFKFLTEVALKGIYLDGNKFSMSHIDPVIKLDAIDKSILQIRYNNYNREIVNHLSYEDTLKFYEAYKKFGQIIQNPDNRYWYQLQKGELSIINNFRVLHGRSSFTGERVLFTAYLPHDDWMSRARTLKCFE